MNHSHVNHSHHSHSHLLHSRCFMSSAPFVHFAKEPLHTCSQVEAWGGRTIRHDFGQRCYNPGLAFNKWRNFEHLPGDYLMTYRSQELGNGISVSHLNLCGVDSCGKLRWTAPLELPHMEGAGTPMHEDGRLFWWESRLFLAYSNVRLRASSVRFKQSLVEIIPHLPADMEHARVFKPGFSHGPLKHLRFGNNSPLVDGHEKNWQFFINAQHQLCFVYSINPHVVVRVADNAVFRSTCDATQDWTRSWGEMHGGTPPLRLHENMYLSFFNSFIGHSEHQRRYVIGAYIFRGEKDGYKVTHVSNKPIIIGSEREGFLWESPTYWEPIVAFATGAHLEGGPSVHDTNVRLSYGVNDCFAETAILPLAALMRDMTRVG